MNCFNRKSNIELKKINILSNFFVIYVKKDLVLMMIIKSIVKSEVIVIILENIEDMLIKFLI